MPLSHAQGLTIGQVVTKTFQGKQMQGVLVTKQEDKGLWQIDEYEAQSIEARQATSDLELRAGQAQATYDALASQMSANASAPADGKELVVVNCIGDGSLACSDQSCWYMILYDCIYMMMIVWLYDCMAVWLYDYVMYDSMIARLHDMMLVIWFYDYDSWVMILVIW